MKFEFDPGKNEINKSKHGLDFGVATKLWDVPGVEATLGIVNGEFRYARLAPIAAVVYIAIFTYRHGPTVRLISFRLATDKETAIYESRKKS